MKNNKIFQILPLAVAIGAAGMGMSGQANAAITLHESDDTTFSVDGLFNTFYVNSDTSADGAEDVSQSRIKMGFLPNYIGFNFSKQQGDLTVGGRSSLWISINDTDVNRGAEDAGTETLIDARQVYATVDGSFGQVLVGKDFGLFGRSNILGDEILLGFGQTMTVTDDGGNVSFGNIGTGYLYPFATAQITYRTPDMSGFNLAVGLLDPSKSSAASEESSPRVEAEATYSTEISGTAIKAWAGYMKQKSEDNTADTSVDSKGLSYGLNLKVAGLALTASGFKAEGVGAAGLGHLVTATDAEVDGTRQHNFAILSMKKKMIIIGGTGYTGEIKKGI
ncbi:MAG: porin, partial [Oceanobacter sp.]